jgi:hypothetical protein
MARKELDYLKRTLCVLQKQWDCYESVSRTRRSLGVS